MIQTSIVAPSMVHPVTHNVFRGHLLKLCIKTYKEVCEENQWFSSSVVHYEIGWDLAAINMKSEVCWKFFRKLSTRVEVKKKNADMESGRKTVQQL